ncbi:MAG: tetratricopeptide repeat protein [Gemmatimonadota bacterium]|nr:MAG: tetratricopeptide repeat protein [Gemmatimonadota bacterium]
MSRLKRLILEIHRRSLWQVLLIYVGGALVAYQAVQALTEGLGLPQWFPGLAVVLFVIGLPFVVATAFVRETGAPPVAPSEMEAAAAEGAAPGALSGGPRPHITWRNAGLSFVVALAVWGVVATGWLLFGGRVVGLTEERESVAVLPFANLSPDPENEFFAQGIHEDILSQLAKIGDLDVISRQSVLQYADTDKPTPRIAAELGVDAILEGSVRRAGDRVRVVTQLIDGRTDAHVWSETYDRELTVANVFEIQSEIAEHIASALQAEFTPEEKQRISSPPTANLEAYDYYLRGLEFFGRSSEEHDFRIAVEMFENATQLDSRFALAYARLSRTHSYMYWFFFDHSPERLQQAKDAVDRSLEIEPDLPEAHEALGFYYYMGHLDYERALQEFEIALGQQPGNVEVISGMGYVERRRGNFEVALTHLENAARLDPRDGSLQSEVGQTYALLRNYAEADAHYDRALALVPDDAEAYVLRALNYVDWEGDVFKAAAVLREAADRGLDTVDHPYLGYMWVLLETSVGQDEAALARLSSGSSAAFSTQHYYVPKAMMAAEIYSRMNEPERARQHLDSAVALLEAAIQETPEDARLHSRLGIAYARQGRVEDAIDAGERAVELLPVSKEAWRGLHPIASLARILTITGRHDEAIDRLEYLLSMPAGISVARLRMGSEWDPLRSHPRFQALLEEYE